jgi:hypothetical protein
MTDRAKELPETINRQNAAIEKLIAERDQLRTRLDGFTATFEAEGSLASFS